MVLGLPKLPSQRQSPVVWPELPEKLPIADLTLDWRDASGRNLDDRIWSNKLDAREAIDRILRDGIASETPLNEVAADLIAYVKPSYSPYGGGRAMYAATRLVETETSVAHALASRQIAMTDPNGGFLRWELSPDHAITDECDDIASLDTGYGRGIYPVAVAPLPPVHPRDKCRVVPVSAADVRYDPTSGMDEFVEKLRVEYGLADPPDLSPEDLALFRAETAQVREDVQLMFNGWFEQTGLVSKERLEDESMTVRNWIDRVEREKQQRRMH